MIEDPSALNGGSDTLPSLKILKHDSDLDSDDEESGHYCEMDEKHAGCTEKFYKQLVLEEVNSNRPQPSDRKDALLRKIKEWEWDIQSDADAVLGAEDIDGDDGNDDLEKRFEGLDIENAQVKDLWDRLLPEEQQNFMRLLGSDNPELSQLVSTYEPWWEVPLKLVNEVDAPSYPEHIPPLPTPLPDFKKMSQHPLSLPLLYNLMHAAMVYTHLQRNTLGGLHDPELLEPNYQQLSIMSQDVLCANARQFMFNSMKDVGIHFANAIDTNDQHRYKLAMQAIQESMAIFNQPKYLRAAIADLHAFTIETSTRPRTKAARSGRARTMHKVHFYLALAIELTWTSDMQYEQLKQELRDDAAVSLQYLADELSNIGRLQDAAEYYRQNMP
ncbi:Zinc finger HIT domain-containing protein 2 [Umbelopsis nana]